MKRFVDKPYYSFTIYSYAGLVIDVVCPRCQGHACVTTQREKGEPIIATLQCKACLHKAVRDTRYYDYTVHNFCPHCDYHYRVEIDNPTEQHRSVLNVRCPRCGTVQQGRVKKTPSSYYDVFSRDTGKMGKDPCFGLRLWYLSDYAGQLVWALNREHLNYIINYVSAHLRQKPLPLLYGKTQSDHLPTFMKTSKNRAGILKVLRRLQEKEA